jgi:hypothetical protein
MKTTTMVFVLASLAAAACGGPDATGQEAPALALDGSPASAAEGVCSPMDGCDPDKPQFCETADGACYLLYPNQHEVPVSCIARPRPPSTPRPNQRCP